MERNLYLRFLRRVGTAIVVLLLLLVCNAQVMAEGYENTLPALEGEAVEEVLQEESYAAVAAQLEAVARAEGRAIADHILYDSFREAAALPASAAAQTPETAGEPGLSVIVVPEKQDGVSIGSLWQVLLVVLLAAVGIWLAAAKYRRQWASGRRVVYKPMRVTAMRTRPYLQYTVQRTYR